MIKQFTISLQLIIVILLLAGCSSQQVDNSISNKEFIVGGEKVVVGRTFDSEFGIGAVIENETTITNNFIPEVKINRWGEEAYIKIWVEDYSESPAQLAENDTVVWETEQRIYKFYPVTLDNGVAGFEYEIVLKEKPKSNIIETKIEVQGLEFHYQPPLNELYLESENCSETECDIDGDGIIDLLMPEDVVGSYAVYRIGSQQVYNNKEEAEKYTTGKAFHIYRPQMVDSKGWKVWGDLEIDIENGIQKIIIPKEFIEKAVYPIHHATGETIGITDEGGNDYTIGNKSAEDAVTLRRIGTTGTPDFNGTLDSVSAYIRAKTGTEAVDTFVAVNEQDSVASGQHGEIGSAESVGESYGSTYSWHTINLSDESISSGTDYIPSVLVDGNDLGTNRALYIALDLVGGTEYYVETFGTYAGGKEDPWTDSLSTNFKFSVYATYTKTAVAEVEADFHFKSGTHKIKSGTHKIKKP